MNLRDTVRTHSPEDLQGFALAADERYWDAMELWCAGKPWGAIYLFGFTAEMLLKVAALKYLAAKPTDLIEPFLPPARKYAKAKMKLDDKQLESFHSLQFWADYLIFRRLNEQKPLPPAIELELRLRIGEMHENWQVSFRYHSGARIGHASGVSVDTQGVRFVNSLDWLIEHHETLWRT